MTKKTELILAVRTLGLPEEINKTGFHAMSLPKISATLDEAGLFLGPRYLLEDMPEFKQIIPYNVVLRDGKVVHYTRTAKAGEGRLHGKMSIGLGGHTDLADVTQAHGFPSHIDLNATLKYGADREIFEELGGLAFTQTAWAGLIVNNDDVVGSVHIGVLGVWELHEPLDATRIEADLSHVGLEDVDILLYGAKPEGVKLEAWTQIVLESEVMYQYTGARPRI